VDERVDQCGLGRGEYTRRRRRRSCKVLFVRKAAGGSHSLFSIEGFVVAYATTTDSPYIFICS